MLQATAGCAMLAQFTEDIARSEGDLPPPADIVHWLEANKFPLLSLPSESREYLCRDVSAQEEIAREQCQYAAQRGEFEIVREAWLSRGIACIMIKSAGNAPAFPHTSDNFDVLVRREQGQLARETLRELGYVELRNAEEPQKYLFRRFHAGKSVLAIHVHEHVGWMVSFLDDAVLWQRMRPAADDQGINVPSPEDAFIINLAHALYENKLLRLNDIARARFALKSAGAAFDWRYVQRIAASRGWLPGLAYVVLLFAAVERALYGTTGVPKSELAAFEGHLRALPFARKQLQKTLTGPTFDLPLGLGFVFCKLLYYRKILADSQRSTGQRWLDVGTTLLDGIKERSGIRPQAGMIVSLSGPDGAGKTAHAQMLLAVFHQCGIKADYFWNRGGSTGIVQVVHRLRHRRAAARAEEGDHLVQRRARLAHPLARFAWSWLVAVDQAGAYFRNAWLPSRRGNVVICDRYIYDTVVEMDRSLPERAPWSRLAIRVALALTPRPGAAYVLEVSRATAKLRRTDEVQPDDLEAQQHGYRVLAAQRDLQMVSNEGLFGDCNDSLARAAITRYMARYETWLNALFIANPSQRNRPDPIWLAGGRA